jgi:hypothetical protein
MAETGNRDASGFQSARKAIRLNGWLAGSPLGGAVQGVSGLAGKLAGCGDPGSLGGILGPRNGEAYGPRLGILFAGAVSATPP